VKRWPNERQKVSLRDALDDILAAAPFLECFAYDWQRGYASQSMASPREVHRGMPNEYEMAWQDAVSSWALRIDADPALTCEEWLAAASDLLSEVQRLSGLASWVLQLRLPSTSTTAERRSCEACGRSVACTVADPIRSGLCHKCDESWRRARGKLDRVEWLRRRQATLAATG